MHERVVIRMPIERDLLNYIQAIEYETEGLKVLHNHALAAELPDKTVQQLYAKYQEKYQEYRLAKDEMWEEYGREYRHAKCWHVDYQRGVMYIEL